MSVSWAQVLDDLEAHVLAAEALIETGQSAELEPWTEPETEGPIPADLVERAQHLSERQLALLNAFPAAIEHTARMRDLAARIVESTGGDERRPSIYIDVQA